MKKYNNSNLQHTFLHRNEKATEPVLSLYLMSKPFYPQLLMELFESWSNPKFGHFEMKHPNGGTVFNIEQTTVDNDLVLIAKASNKENKTIYKYPRNFYEFLIIALIEGIELKVK